MAWEDLFTPGNTWKCNDCGALVLDGPAHLGWHEKHEERARLSKLGLNRAIRVAAVPALESRERSARAAHAAEWVTHRGKAPRSLAARSACPTLVLRLLAGDRP